MSAMLFRSQTPVIRKRPEHCISRKNIDRDALRVLYRLSDAGYTAYLVGGGVRDLLLGRTPKDFDVGTDAKPNEIKHLFRNCFLIGRRFRLAHIRYGQNIIETSTFRKMPPPPDDPVDTLYQRDDNTFGTPKEDALRRDFTVNGLFYDIKTFNVIDYVGGLHDLEKRVLRCIGDPNIRFREDPVRMMRAVRLAAVLGFRIDWMSRFAIKRHYREIEKAALPRVQEEILRLFSRHAAAPAFRLLHELKMMSLLIPDVDTYIKSSGEDDSPLWKMLEAFDADPASDDSSNALKLAVLYYPLFRERLAEAEGAAAAGPRGKGGRHPRDMRVNHLNVARELLRDIAEKFRFPRAAYFGATAILDAQRRFESPEQIRPGAFRGELFDDALAFFRIRLAADGLDTAPAHEIARRMAQARADMQPLYSEDVAAVRDDDSTIAPDAEDDGASNSERPFGRRRRGRRRRGRSSRKPRNLPNLEVSGSPFPSNNDNNGAADSGAVAKE